MDAKEYAALAIRTVNPNAEPMMNALLGIAGESGEVCDYMKKVLFHDKAFDRDALVAELGDLLWYVNQLLFTIEADWSEVFEKNIKKLSKRYPELTFSVERANNKDAAAEMEAMRS